MNVLDRERGSKDLKAWRNQISNINKSCWQLNCGPNIGWRGSVSCLLVTQCHGLRNIDSASPPSVIVICVSPCDNYLGQRPWGPRCGLGNGHRGNVMSSNVVQDLINDQQTSQSMSSWGHTQDGICVSFVWIPMMIIQHFLNVVASAAPNSRGQTVLIITNDDKKRSETKYNPPFV